MDVIQETIANQHTFYNSNQSKDVSYRLAHLNRLRQVIKTREAEITKALKLDLGKSQFEAYSSEVGFILKSLDHIIKHLKTWTKPEYVRSPLFMPISKSSIHYEPRGVVLIIGPFNYPFQLVIEPLIGAIAAGNTCVLKPSEKTPHTTQVIEDLIEEVFEPGYVDVISGGKEVVTELIHSEFDYIFFTGSTRVGKVIMEAASKQLIPVTLELGGKSPTIVHEDADIEKAAARIVWGKFFNAGQTCIAPDYVYVHENVKEAFLIALKETIKEFYGKQPLQSPDYGQIIDDEAFKRLSGYVDVRKLFHGGRTDREKLKIEPTVLMDVTWSDEVMQDEIFGPILPVLSYENIEETLKVIKSKPRPLALYLFTEDNALQKEVTHNFEFGGGCINDTLSHVTSPYLPLGGTGNSGMGAYHGKESFLTFSHKKSMMKKSTKMDIKAIYPPYEGKLKLIKKIMK